GSALSLERQLQILMATVLACILATSLALTYNAITSSSETILRERLSRASKIIARTVEDAVASRTRAVHAVATDSIVHVALRESAAAPSGARAPTTPSALSAHPLSPATLALLQQRLDRYLDTESRHDPMELWSVDGRRIATGGAETLPLPVDLRVDSLHPIPREKVARLRLTDSPFVGDIFSTEESAYFYWTVAPVTERGRLLGYLAERVRIGGPEGIDAWVRDLTGEEVQVHVRSGDGREWLARAGVRATPPIRRDSSKLGVTFVRDRDERMFVGESNVAGTTWEVVLESPQRALHARAIGIVGKLALISLALVALGVLASHYMGKRITRPLASLTTAAEAITSGDYSRRVIVSGRDEIGRLASSFNQMATEVDAAHRELERRVRDAMWAADELENTNRQLLDSMVEAEHARREAEDARSDAERANLAKSDFLAVMSHELRTPLNAIGGYAQLLELGIHGPVTDAQRDALERIARSQAHLLRLINDVLYFARIDASRVQYAMADVSVEETLRALEPLVAPQLHAKSLNFVYHPSRSDLTVHADRDRLQQIVLNLLTNAIKYTLVGGGVTLDCQEQATEICIRVRDTGVGIPADRLRSIFDPFVQVDRGRSRPNDGVGLGLAISRDLARGMGGELSVESTLGVGSSFTLMLARGADLGSDPRSAPDSHVAAGE
ncbi:MAG: ATP-binding protein, partial [Gemmatimonadaceae bacterium]